MQFDIWLNLCIIWYQMAETLHLCRSVLQADVVKHFVARALCLIVLPTLIYIATFAVHLKILNHRLVARVYYLLAYFSQFYFFETILFC